MIGSLQIPLGEIIPSVEDVLRGQGIPAAAVVKETVRALVGASLDVFSSEADPRCLAADVSPRVSVPTTPSTTTGRALYSTREPVGRRRDAWISS